MLINDYSTQDFLDSTLSKNKQNIIEFVAACTIFLAPIIFLIFISSGY